MKCAICNSDSRYYFSKKYTETPYSEFMKEIGEVNYYKCTNCGFVLSKTHRDLNKNQWNNLNILVHNYIENTKDQDLGNQPPYIEQAMMLRILSNNNIINSNDMLDYASGYGTLSKLLLKYFNIEILLFDPYINDLQTNRYVVKPNLDKYSTVINSAMFEHILNREDLDNVNNCVDKDGCLIVHTVVCENIPNDTNWFYLRPPVHTAFHTNKSMEILMSQWGYHSSIYCPQSKSWVLLKNELNNISFLIESINQELQTDYLYYKNGFVDYWKGF
jgi:hypothetical protein